MKKSTILIAVLAVMSAISVARAEEFKMDFDGNLKSQSMHDIFANSHQFIPAPKLSQIETPSELSDSQHGFACSNAQLAFACSPGEYFSAFTCKCTPGSLRQDEGALFYRLNEGVVNGVIQGAINATEGKGPVMVDLKNLLKYGTIKEKEAFVYNNRGTYSFPAGIISRRFDTGGGEGVDNKNRNSLNLTCNEYVTVQVCTNRLVCRTACAAAAGAAGVWAGGSIGAGAAIGASGQICQELCENVKECSDVRECASWSSNAGSGTDPHGNYRGRVIAFQN